MDEINNDGEYAAVNGLNEIENENNNFDDENGDELEPGEKVNRGSESEPGEQEPLGDIDYSDEPAEAALFVDENSKNSDPNGPASAVDTANFNGNNEDFILNDNDDDIDNLS